MDSAAQPAPQPSRLARWLSIGDPVRTSDLIFVLAGRTIRKEYALELFRQGLAPKILFSVGRFEIRRFSKMPLPVPLDLLALAQPVPPPERHYFVFFHAQQVTHDLIRPGRFGTLAEIRALHSWLSAHPDVHSILIVSSPTHLRRIRLCCRALLSRDLHISYIATPEPGDTPTRESAASHLRELLKLLLYWFLLKFR